MDLEAARNKSDVTRDSEDRRPKVHRLVDGSLVPLKPMGRSDAASPDVGAASLRGSADAGASQGHSEGDGARQKKSKAVQMVYACAQKAAEVASFLDMPRMRMRS